MNKFWKRILKVVPAEFRKEIKMQNDVLKNEIAPWQEKGRGYHGVVESDGTAWTIKTDESDAIFSTFSIVSTNYISLFSGYAHALIDYKYRLLAEPTATYNVPNAGLTYRISSSQLFFLLPVANYKGKIELWFYIV